MKKLFIIFLLPAFSTTFSQNFENKFNFLEPSDSLNKSRKISLIMLHTIFIGSNTLLLDHHFYEDKKKSSLHFIKDKNASGMADKYTHSIFSYQFTRLSNQSFIWSGTDYKTSLIFSNIFGVSVLTIKEIFDGFTDEIGWSWYDFSTNFIGAGLFTGQELIWHKQRIQPKLSFNDSKTNNFLSDNNRNISERLLKNYEGYTFWLSFNLNSFLKTEYIPNWLNFSIGYSVNGYLKSKDPEVINEKYKSYYISIDIDLTEIKTNSHFLKTLFSVLNTIKIPAPTIQFNTNDTAKAYLFYF